ncbi:hypothetical protein [Psychrobacillus sp. FSL H8-0487]|uniref:hypothetical protein n=1 Tax=Psychrobacillus sp. FSL H8-0487 TaxID=2921391 RepID=UPI0030FC9C68
MERNIFLYLEAKIINDHHDHRSIIVADQSIIAIDRSIISGYRSILWDHQSIHTFIWLEFPVKIVIVLLLIMYNNIKVIILYKFRIIEC